MSGNIRPFQIVLLASFGFLAIVAIYLVRVYNPPADESELRYGNQVIVWGTIPRSTMSDIMNSVTDVDKNFEVVDYYQVDERSFANDLVNAIAEGRSPDLIMLPATDLVQHRAKILPIPYENLPERSFRDTYIDGAEVFMLRDGVYALPFAVDPLMMYWNRDLFASNGVALPPTTWESLVSQTVPALTVRDTSRNILQSGIAFGEYVNVANAKAVLLMLAMQSGSKLVYEDDRGYELALNVAPSNEDRPPLDAAVEFFTDFSNANSPLYSWNRAQSSDVNAFVAEELAIYFGLGSEAPGIAAKNPNLNYDVAPVPQGATATVKRTYGEFYGWAIPRGANNPQGGYAAALTLSSSDWANAIAKELNMSAPHRSVINAGDSDSVRQVVLKSALIARSWLDPEPNASDSVFTQMIEDVTSGRSRVNTAVSDAIRRLSFEY